MKEQMSVSQSFKMLDFQKLNYSIDNLSDNIINTYTQTSKSSYFSMNTVNGAINNNTTNKSLNPSWSPPTLKHSDLINVWYLINLDGIDKRSELIFYEISSSKIKVLPLGNYRQYKDYNYLYNNELLYFGSGPFKVSIIDDELILSSKYYKREIIFKRASHNDVQSIITVSPAISVNERINNVNTTYSQASYNEINPNNVHEKIVRIDVIEDIRKVMCSFSWKDYCLMYRDYSITKCVEKSNFKFNSNYTFAQKNPYGITHGKYEFKNRSLILDYDDGFSQTHSSIYVEHNQTSDYYYLYISDETRGYEGCYTVYKGTTNK